MALFFYNHNLGQLLRQSNIRKEKGVCLDTLFQFLLSLAFTGKNLFRLLESGQLVMTRGVSDVIANNEEFTTLVHQSLKRHLAGDWGEVCDEDRTANELALQEGDRLFSAYKKEGLPKIWVITEWDRSVTAVLFPEEY
jgi:hypothetical protein